MIATMSMSLRSGCQSSSAIRADDVQTLDHSRRGRIDDLEIRAERRGDIHRPSLVAGTVAETRTM